MISCPIGFLIGVGQVKTAVCKRGDRFEDGDAVRPSSAEVVHLTRPRSMVKVNEQLGNIGRMYLISDLFALEAKDRVRPACDRASDDVIQIPVQLDRGVSGAGQAPASEDADRHLEISSELLTQDVGRDLGSAEERMQAVIDRQLLVDPVAAVGVVKSRLQLAKEDRVWAIAVHLVRTRKAERRISAEVASCDEQIQRADGVHVEIVVWKGRSQVVGRLSSRVDDEIGAFGCEYLSNRSAVSDINRYVTVR